MMASWFEHFLNRIFPRRCPICQTILPSDSSASLCADCLPDFQAEAAIPCPVCHHPPGRCTCIPTRLQALSVPVLTTGFYLPQKCPAHAKLIYTLKHSAEDTAARICARHLSIAFLQWRATASDASQTWVFTYPPRSAENLEQYGFDQSARLAQMCAANCNGKFMRYFQRKNAALQTQQKFLHAEQRRENVERTLFLRQSAKVRDQNIVLIDDILTTGSTVAHCASLLLKNGAAQVVVLSVLKTPIPLKKQHVPSELWFQT